MAIYKTKWFGKWASKNGLLDAALRTAVEELECDLYDASLGGGVYKKRVGISNQGKRGGARTLIAYKKEANVFLCMALRRIARLILKLMS